MKLAVHVLTKRASVGWPRVAAEIAVSRAEELSRMRRDAGYCRVVAMG